MHRTCWISFSLILCLILWEGGPGERPEHFGRSPTSNPDAQPLWEPPRSATESGQRRVLNPHLKVFFFFFSERKGSTYIVNYEMWCWEIHVVLSTMGYSRVEDLGSGSQFSIMKSVLSEVILQTEFSLTLGTNNRIQNFSNLGLKYHIYMIWGLISFWEGYRTRLEAPREQNPQCPP